MPVKDLAFETLCVTVDDQVLTVTLDDTGNKRMRRASRQLYKDMLEVGQPIVCAVNGPAIGAGCSLVLLSDFAFASSTVTPTSGAA